ncbi:MAG TPA: kynureninase [Stellaceae bacterium]|nr:kynureninase [Stellaceae bacterium]
MTITREDCVARDAADPLAPFRERFALPDGVIYLDGNSLGALPRTTAARVAQVVEEEWGRHLITSWNRHDWIDLPHRIGDKLGRLIGATPGEAIVADSTSVNLYKMLSGALALRPERRVILSEVGNFPTDLYIAEGLIEQLGRGHELRTVTADEVPDALGDDVAVAMLTHVNYRTGRMYDMAATTALAHRHGALMLWDLAHSAGAVPVDLGAANADLAVGCGYKYLNGGPGAPAFLYIAQRLQDSFRQPLSGWLGHAVPFAFDPHYRPAEGIRRAMVGTPPVISLAALEVGIDLMLEADMAALRTKSLALGDLFIALAEQECGPFGFEMVSPRDRAMRGSQVSLVHAQGYAIMQALIARGVIGDFRAPDILRFGLTPLYLGYAEIWDAVRILKDVMTTGAWDHPDFHRRAAVT